MLALIPLLARMALIHIVLIYGTNNIQTDEYDFTDSEIRHRQTGSGLVLAARISYAAFIWTSKLTVSEFLKRITIRIWRPSHEATLRGIRIFLAITFVAVIVATLAECQPFEHYWQVIPDPGPQCRQGYAQLLTMGTCDMITDILLVAFPIPIVLKSGQTWKRKLQLGSLFSLSAIMIAITGLRMDEVIDHHGRQQYRTVWASCEILASTAVSNAVILGSFLRDKGTKKNKWKSQSVSDSVDRASVRRPTLAALHEMGSDEDLFRFLGCRVPAHLRHESDSLPRPAPAALPAFATNRRNSGRVPQLSPLQSVEPDTSGSEASQDSLGSSKPIEPEPSLPSPAPSPRKPSVSFFDVGGLLEHGSSRRPSPETTPRAPAETRASRTLVQDFAPPSPMHSRRDSHAIATDARGPSSHPTHQDTACLPHQSSDLLHQPSRPPRPNGFPASPAGVVGPMLERRATQHSLQDAGGLLSRLMTRE